jgi:4-diphosphocytidyl-2-C-methyl-D-erythritol kinase
LTVESDNLILLARDKLLDGRTIDGRPYHLTLDKQLPIASGVGGGSADAAATLRLLRDSLPIEISDEALYAIASNLGSDVPACLAARPVIATGRGDQLRPAPALPDLAAVLVNPNLPSPTGAVYRAYDRAVVNDGEREPDWPARLDTIEAVTTFLAGCRNDLQPPAVAMQPAIATVLAELQRRDEVLFARMSGSGATCFGLCRSIGEASELAAGLLRTHPDWWVRACTLRGA